MKEETYNKLINIGKELEQIAHIDLENSETRSDLKELSEKILLLYIELDPKNPIGYKWLGYTYMHGNDLEKSEKVFKKGLEVARENEGNPERFTYALGNVYRRKGELEKAIEFYKEAIEKDEDPIFFSHLCLTYARQGEKQKAKDWANKGLEAYEKYPEERDEKVKSNLERYKNEDIDWGKWKEVDESVLEDEEVTYKRSSDEIPDLIEELK